MNRMLFSRIEPSSVILSQNLKVNLKSYKGMHPKCKHAETKRDGVIYHMHISENKPLLVILSEIKHSVKIKSDAPKVPE